MLRAIVLRLPQARKRLDVAAASRTIGQRESSGCFKNPISPGYICP
jgi:hypothetical protein